MAKHRRRRHSRKSRTHLKGLGAIETSTALLILGGVAVVGVGAFLLLKKPAVANPYPGYGNARYQGQLPAGVTQSTADMLLQKFGPMAIDALAKYGPQAVDYLTSLFGEGGGGGGCQPSQYDVIGTCADYRRYPQVTQQGACFIGWNGQSEVVFTSNPASQCGR